jgi:hypothetical protein
MDAVIFQPAAPLYEVYPDLDARLRECVTEALKPHASYKPVNLAVQVVLVPTVHLGHYRGKWWVTGALSNNRSEVGVTVGAFDDIDARHEVKLRLENILNLLAVWTNCSLEEQQTAPNADALDKSLADFWTDTDWIDDRPTSDGRALLERECIAFCDEIVAGHVAANDALLRSMRLFHQGISISNDSRTMGDLAAVLLVSALECISEGEPTTCKECGQAVYKISQRVLDLGVKHLGEGSAWLFKRHYAFRSKYLHSGRMVSTQPITGYSIPQLDPDAPEGCAISVGAGHPHNLIEFVSYVIRGEIRNYVRDRGL